MAVGSDKLRLLRRIPDIRFEEELRGYSKNQVDRVLENLAPLADEIEALQQRLERAEASPVPAPAAAPVHESAQDQGEGTTAEFDETLRNTLLLAQRTADKTVKDAESEAEQLRSDSTAKADSIMASARAEAKELKGEAHAQREQMLADAEAEQARLLDEARTHANERRAAVETELTELEGATRAELVAEIEKLRVDRSELDADVKRFEEFLTKRRDAIRLALGEIETVIDDPEQLAEIDPPEPVEVDMVDADDLPPIAIESSALLELDDEANAAAGRVAEQAELKAQSELKAQADAEAEEAETARLAAAEAERDAADQRAAEAAEIARDAEAAEAAAAESFAEEERRSEQRRLLEDRRSTDEDLESADNLQDLGFEPPAAVEFEADSFAAPPPPAQSDAVFVTETLDELQSPATAEHDDQSGSGMAPFVAPESVFAQTSPSSFTDPSGLGIDIETPDYDGADLDAASGVDELGENGQYEASPAFEPDTFGVDFETTR